MFVIVQKKAYSDKEAFERFGLRRVRGKTTFSPEHLVQAHAAGLLSGAATINYQEEMEKQPRPGICVIRIGGLGDLIMLSASLKKLKEKYPQKPLILATAPQHQRIFINCSFLDDCISVFDVHRYEFDRTIDLRYAVEPKELTPGKGKLHWKDYTGKDRALIFDKLCGVNSSRHPFEAPVIEKYRQGMKRILGGGGPMIGLTPTCRAQYRAMPHDYIRPLAKMLTRKGKVILFGKTESWDDGLADLEMPGLVNLLNRTSGNNAIALCSHLDLLITPDSGFLHVAGALGKKTLAVFGNIDPKTRISFYPTVQALYAKDQKVLSCCPCWDLHRDCKTLRGSAPCMRLITPEQIFERAKEMINA